MLRLIVTCVCLLLLPSPGNLAARQKRRVYVDRGACEGEACGYGPWKPTRATVLRARPDARSRRVGEVGPGPCVMALTGEVQVRTPGRFVVLKPRGLYRPGEVLTVYTYLGEEVYKVRHRGRWVAEQQLTYTPEPGPAERQECMSDQHCWGFFERKPDSTWWVKVRTGSGLVGWTDEPTNFIDPYWQDASDCKELHDEMRRKGAGPARR